MKQTAIEWLVKKYFEDYNVLISELEYQQAIEMEKQQIIDADLAGVKRTVNNVHNNLVKIPEVIKKIEDMESGKLNHENGQEYYNQTYGKSSN